MLRTALPVIMQCRLMEREFIKGGRAAGRSPKEFPKKQIKMGIKVEHEHTPKRGIAQEIAMDHLAEFPDYYTRLHKMEAQAKRAHRVAESATHRAMLQETSRLVRELMSGRLNAQNVGRVRSAGILRSPETMEQGLDVGSRELAKRHRIAKMPKEFRVKGLPMSFKTSSLRGVRSSLFKGASARELEPLDKVVGAADRRNLKGYANIPKDSGPLVRRHEIDEVRSKSPKTATIVGGDGEMVGKHSGLDVLARERENAIRLGVHGSKVPHAPSKYTGDKSILAARHGTGEYELVKKHAGETELPLTSKGKRNLARAKPDATDDLGGDIFHTGERKKKNTRTLPRNFLGGRNMGVTKPEVFDSVSRYKALRKKWGYYGAGAGNKLQRRSPTWGGGVSMESSATQRVAIKESALPATKRCRLMEMIELKPWINRARANTPEADALASGVRRVALLDKRRAKVSKLQVPGKASKKDRLLARIRLARDGAAFNAIHGSNSIVRGYSRANSSLIGERADSTHAGNVVASSMTDANYDLASDKVLGRGRGDPMMSEFHRRGDKIRDMGRPSPASKKPEGPQDLRLNKKPWYQFWGGKEAPKPEPMDVKAPLVRKRYWAESSIVRRGILQEGFFKPPVRRALQDAKKVGIGFVSMRGVESATSFVRALGARQLTEALVDMDPDIRDGYGIKALDNRSARHANKVKKLMGADAEVYDAAGGSIYDPSSHVVGWHKGPSARRHARAAKQAARLDQKYIGNAEKRAEKAGFDVLSASPSDAMRRIFPRSSKVSAAAAKVGRRSAYTLAHELVHSKDPTSSGELRGEALANASLLNPRLSKKSARNQSMRASMAAHLQNERNIRRSAGMSARDVNKKWRAFRNAGGFSPSGVKGALHLLASAAMAQARLKESK